MPLPFVFVVPFLSRQVAADWEGVSLRLAHSLRLCLSQTSSADVHVILAAHEVPDIIQREFVEGGRVQVVHSPIGPPAPGAPLDIRRLDKHLKQKAAAIHAGAVIGGPAHLMLLDGDDLVSIALVETVRAQAPAANVIIRHGYRLHFPTRSLVEVPGPGAADTTFDRASGSSGVFFLHPSDFPTGFAEGGLMAKGKVPTDRLFLRFGGHKRWRETFQGAGRPHVEPPERLAIYVKDHGSNITMKRPRAIPAGRAGAGSGFPPEVAAAFRLDWLDP